MAANSRYPLSLNVGFILHQSSGYFRDFEFNQSALKFDQDFNIEQFEGTLRLVRSTEGILAQGDFQATTRIACMRCLEDYNQSIEINIQELYSYPAGPEADPILSIPETGILDLTPTIREAMLVAIPIRPLCNLDCRGLCQVCGNNLNHTSCQHEDENIDPRLSVLKTLLDS